MATFTQIIEKKCDIRTYEDTQNIYNLLVKAIQNTHFSNLEIKAHFSFEISEISCKCYSVEEFSEYAYGQSDFSLDQMQLVIKSDNPLSIISLGRPNYNIFISAESKILLQLLVSAIQDIFHNESVASVTYDRSSTVSYTDSQIISINGNNNVLVNNSSLLEPQEKKKESKFKQWLIALGQNLMANGVWYILCILGAFIVAKLI